MTQLINMAVVGAGLIGTQHIKRIQMLDSTQIIAVVDPENSTQHMCQQEGISYYPTIEAMFEHCQPDGVILATPTLLHVSQATLCLEHRCPVLIEKPIAVNSSEAEKIVAIGASTNTPILVGHHRRHNPLVQQAKNMITAGELGEIRALQMQCWLYKSDDYFAIAPWRKQKGAGPISVNLVHDIDLARHLCGEIESVYTMARPSSRGFENEDTAAAVLRFTNGAVGTVSVSDSIVAPWSWEMTAKENPAYSPVEQSSYQIGGSHGSLSIPDLTLWQSQHKRCMWEPLQANHLKHNLVDPLTNQILQFTQVIMGNEQPLVSGLDGWRSLMVIEALQQSAAQQKTIHLHN